MTPAPRALTFPERPTPNLSPSRCRTPPLPASACSQPSEPCSPSANASHASRGSFSPPPFHPRSPPPFHPRRSPREKPARQEPRPRKMAGFFHLHSISQAWTRRPFAHADSDAATIRGSLRTPSTHASWTHPTRRSPRTTRRTPSAAARVTRAPGGAPPASPPPPAAARIGRQPIPRPDEPRHRISYLQIASLIYRYLSL